MLTAKCFDQVFPITPINQKAINIISEIIFYQTAPLKTKMFILCTMREMSHIKSHKNFAFFLRILSLVLFFALPIFQKNKTTHDCTTVTFENQPFFCCSRPATTFLALSAKANTRCDYMSNATSQTPRPVVRTPPVRGKKTTARG
jgi:hypothetical protein